MVYCFYKTKSARPKNRVHLRLFVPWWRPIGIARAICPGLMFDGCNLFTNGAFTLGFSFSRFFLKSFVHLIYSRHKITSSLLTLFKCGCCLGDEWNIKYFAHFITISIWQFYLKELLRFWALGRISRSPRL